jgi:serine/threonine-protein kinase HipA
MINELFVVIGDDLAGRLMRRDGKLRFTYSEEYRLRPSTTPLSVSMSIQTAEYTDRVIAPWIAGLLPDNEGVLARWSRSFQVANTAFALLGTTIGEDCAGAVRFVAAERLSAALERTGEVAWLDEAGVASRLRDLQADETSWLGSDFTGRFSLAGAQAKTALLYQGGRWGIPTGAAATTHILKPAIKGLDDHDLNEHLCLRAARNLGLAAAATRIEVFEDQSAVVSERYDRAIGDTGWARRIHQEDLCQATGHRPELKYQNEGGPTSTDIARLLRRVLPGRVAEDSVWRFFEALTLNWLICGTDAHAKNYSLLLSGAQVRLAPLYDVASALPYKLPVQKMRLAMKFGGSYLLAMRSSSLWQKVAAELGLPTDAVRERAGSLMNRLPDAFADAARDPEVVRVESTLPQRLVDGVAARVATSRATLMS